MSVRYDPVGQCIYCGTKEPPLGREHIVAFGLEGDIILPEASCKECGKITGRIEQIVLRGLFGSIRSTTQMRSRRPKERPTSHKAEAQRGDDLPFLVDIPVEEYPATLPLPVYPPARYLLGLPDTDEPVQATWWIWSDNGRMAALAEKLGIPEGSLTLGECNPSRLSQMLAKIGHASAVAEYGINGFRPLAVDLALGAPTTLITWSAARKSQFRPRARAFMSFSLEFTSRPARLSLKYGSSRT